MKKCLTLIFIGLFLSSFSSVFASGLKGKFAINSQGGFGFPMGDFADKGSFSTSFSDSMMGSSMKEKGSAKSGFGFGFNLEYFVTDNVAIGGNFTYQKFGMETGHMEREFISEDEELFMNGKTNFDGEHKITCFGVYGKYLFSASPRVSPYLRFGLGMGKMTSKLDLSGSYEYDYYNEHYEYSFNGTGERESDTKLYFELGGGILFHLSEKVGITGELLYTHLATDGSDGDIDVSLKGKIAYEYEGVPYTETFTYYRKWKDDFDFNADWIKVYVGLSFFFGGKQ
jgi:opacity protein-like surface antigen